MYTKHCAVGYLILINNIYIYKIRRVQILDMCDTTPCILVNKYQVWD